MEDTCVKRGDMKNDGSVQIKYKRKFLASRKFRLSCGQSTYNAVESHKDSKQVVSPNVSGESVKSETVDLLQSGSQDFSKIMYQSGFIETPTKLVKEESLQSEKGIFQFNSCESKKVLDQSPSPVSAAKDAGAQLPRRYPSRTRVSAVRNFSSGCGKDVTPSTRSESLGDKKVRIGGAVSQSVSRKDEKEVCSSSSKKRKKEGTQHKNNAIKKDEEDSSLKQEADEKSPIDQEVVDLRKECNGHPEEIVTRKKVRETLRLFQAIYRKLLQEEESKRKDALQSFRVDLRAFKLFKEKFKEMGDGKRYLGNVPGVEVGDEFHFRVELCILGLHCQHTGGIDFIQQGERNLAVSIVSYGRSADEVGSSDVLVYSGFGVANEHQKLERGNLALKNSMDAHTPVRVIHGFRLYHSNPDNTKGKTVPTYIYDGLYSVEKQWRKKGNNGYYVLMFQLRKMPGQPELAMKQIMKSRKMKTHYGLCIEDISQGQEKIPICAVNTVDNEHPMPFQYITKMIYPSQYNPTPRSGCDCTDGCSDSEKCACAVKNGGEIPFNYSGSIVEAKPLVYECGPSCKCPPSCHNRVSQHGIKFQLEIFKTESMGWGVRSLTSIPSGSFICEYTGELLNDEEAQKRTNDEYLFSIGNNYYDEALWEGLSTFIPDLQKSASCKDVEDAGFTVDASEYGNIGRFINHSCTPNLYAQNLLHDHDDKNMPHIMLFASENIPPLQELTYHYNYTIDQVHDSDGNIKKKICHCGSIECEGRLY